ncbi:MAG TPA: bifunctional adenosylcobinamide kinase/adenosylcobinamide-phosphate guanylyltransferase [Nitrospiraceae bacterium]|jgi:adenosylcobinamide kinase/adenosylcobinamide-phosphate guanylyltransferase|nr:bifunctional adenosylcobinamide kinase/adenosylcobinamide-phosphate guanylyltransferase [Nitrospiraceae bacterium]
MAGSGSRIIFVIGGAKSGKSTFALRQASERPGKKAYIATAQAFDREMEERIARHRKERSAEWETFEEPKHISAVIREITNTHDVILLDCLTLWISNLLLTDEALLERYCDDFIEMLGGHTRSYLCIVSNEVGMGIVPESTVSRKFRDCSGYLNQRVAHVANEVYLIAAGIPLKIK